MKYLVASDIHGSLFYTKKLVEIIKLEKIDKLILLGDLYYHGPRNPLSFEYNPKEVSNILNSYKDIIHVVKGNCDAEVDEMISEFKFYKIIKMNICGKRMAFTHGHIYNIDKPLDDIDILIYGHFHTGYIKEKDNIIYINSGSLSLPKNDTKNSYLITEDNTIYLKDLEQNVINKINF